MLHSCFVLLVTLCVASKNVARAEALRQLKGKHFFHLSKRRQGKYFVPLREKITKMTALTAAQQRIQANEQEYNRLKADPSYTNVKFDCKTGGLMAIHKGHNFDPTVGRFGIPRGDYERLAVEVLYKNGRSVVLTSEKNLSWRKMPDGRLDDSLFDIKGIEGKGKRNIEHKITEANKQGVETIVLYYHDKNIFDKQRIIDSYDSYLRNSESKRIKTLYYIVDGQLYQLARKPTI
jgi:hypothetical protein